MIIKSTADISIESLNDLIAQENIFYITIKDEENYPVGRKYDIFELLSIKRIMQDFLKGCPAYDKNNPDSEKEIFSYIYVKLAYWAEYDKLAHEIKNSKGTFKKFVSDYLDEAAGLEGFWLGGAALSTGFAETLRNLLAEKGIEAKFMYGTCRNEYGEKVGHTWNQVNLGGEWFNCDVLNDKRYIVDNMIEEGEASPYFLRANYDFSHYKKYFIMPPPKIEKGRRSLSDDEQRMLIMKYKEIVLDEIALNEEKTRNKKKGFFKSIAEKLKRTKPTELGEE